MLNIQEQTKIREEELFRIQVREALQEETATKPASSSKVYVFFNSALGIWILSTIFVGFFSWTYTQYTAYARKCILIVERHEKLVQEVDYRAENLSFMFKNDKLIYNYDAGDLKCKLSAAINGNDCIIDSVVQRGYLHTEYKGFNVDQLFYQINDIEESNNSLSKKINDVHEKYTEAFYRVETEIHSLSTDAPNIK